ncbi:MAG: hypothetical protein LC096_05400 [Bacteroidia bacterium]|nr:hypothetical protein [Bacteroidia bacterium]
MEKGSQTLSGTWSTLKDTLGTVARRIVGLSDTGEVIKGGLIDKLKDGVKLLTDTLEYFSTSEGIAKMENFLNTLKTLFPIITGAIIGGLIPAFYGWATAALAALVPLLPWIAIGALIGGAIFLIVKAVKALIPVFKNMVEWVKDAWGAIVNFFKTLPETISKIWTSIIDGIKSFFDGFVELITYWIPYAIGYVIGWFATLPERIGEALTNTWNNIKKWVTDTWNYLKVEIPKWITNIFNWFKELPGKIKDGLSNLGSTIKTSFSDAWNTLKEEISQWPSRIWDWGKNIAQSFIDGFKNALSGIANAFKDTMNNAKRFIQGKSPPKEGPLKDIDKWGSNIGQAWVQGFANSIGGIGTMFDSSMAQLQSLLSSPSFSVDGATAGGGNTQNISINGVSIRDKGDIDALIRQLGFKLSTI